ncbi:MAG: hypothetical protein J5984_03570 [Clostridia bacterium]|nr:hypothetical protein [Clostridia bacterium]
MANTDNTSRESLENIKEFNAEKERLEKLTNSKILEEQKLSDREYINQLMRTCNAKKSIMTTLKSEIKAIYKDIASYAETEIEQVLNSQKKLENKLKDFGDRYFGKFTFKSGGKTESLNYLNDFENDIRKLTLYRDNILNIKNKIGSSGFSDEIARAFFNEIASMDIGEALNFSNVLLSVDDSQFKDFISGWDKKQNLSREISAQLYSDDFGSAVDSSVDYMREKLEAVGFQVPEGFFTSGTVSARNFGSAFIHELDSQLAKIRTKINGFTASLTSPAGSTSRVSNVNTTNNININGNGMTNTETVNQMKRTLAVIRAAGINGGGE